MTIWLLALVLLALGASVGRQQGAIRGAITFVGLVFAAKLAMPLSHPMQSIVGLFGVKHPIVRELLAPAIVFIVVLIVFKIVGQAVHQKIVVHYKYKAADEARLKWERLESRVGMCVGLLNGAFYFFVLLLPIYICGYLTVQVASGSEDSALIRLVSQARQDLHATKLDKAVAGLDPAPKQTYEAFDIIGLIFKNPAMIWDQQREGRLFRYPGILTLVERQEFQDLANDADFRKLVQSGAKVGDILKHPRVQSITKNPALVSDIQKTTGQDLADLREFLETGKSPKYGDEKIIGRWAIDLTETYNMQKQSRPNVSPAEMRQLRARLTPLASASLVAMTDNRVLIKRGQAPGLENLPRILAEGTWAKESGIYKMTFTNKTEEVLVDEDKMLLPNGGVTLVFQKEM